MPEKAYITILGRSTWALVNTYYAVLMEKSYYPDIVHIFAEDTYAEELDKAIKGIKILSEEFGFTPEIERHIVKEADFIEAGMKISCNRHHSRQKGSRCSSINSGDKAQNEPRFLSCRKKT